MSWLTRHFYTVFFGIFATVGTLLGAIGAYWWYDLYTLRRDGIETVGVVSDMLYSEGMGAPVVRYRGESGETLVYRSSTYSNPPAYEMGEEVKLWYRPEDPTNPTLSGLDTWLVPTILSGFFVIFGAIGYGGLISRWLRSRRSEWLSRHGRPMTVELLEVYYDSSVQLNGRSPYRIVGQHFDPQRDKVYTFKSEPIWFDPEPYLPADGKLKIHTAPHNLKQYRMDTSFLPKDK